MKTNCLNCNHELKAKSGLFSNSITEKEFIESEFNFIKKYTDITENSFCDACIDNAKATALRKFRSEYDKVVNFINDFQQNIPILSIQNLPKWSYNILSIVTGQSTMGTGFLTELKSSWGDLLGVESKSVNLKITEGETNCYKQMRSKAIAMGGNCIIGVDIDYAEMGGVKSMVMVCTAGTVIEVTDLSVFGAEYVTLNEGIKQAKQAYELFQSDMAFSKKYLIN